MRTLVNKIIAAFLALMLISSTACTSSQFTEWSSTDAKLSSDIQISKLEFEKVALNKIEDKTREASVKVYTELGGHGSGAYFIFEGYHVVFTAAHVVSSGNTFLIVDKYGNKRTGILAYREVGADFAIILIPAFKRIKPISFKTPKYDPTKEIGRKLIFSGYPARQSLRTVRALIAGVEGRRFVMHSTGWKGSSGSCVFDEEGRFVGIAFAISMARFNGSPVLLESMIWVEPYTAIKWNDAKRLIRSLN
jgi:hypothetical protein